MGRRRRKRAAKGMNGTGSVIYIVEKEDQKAFKVSDHFKE